MPGQSETTLESLLMPWDRDRPSILSAIDQAILDLGDEQDELFVDLETDSEFKMADGFMDLQVASRDNSELQTRARRLASAIGSLVRQPTTEGASYLYGLLVEGRIVAIVEELLDRLDPDLPRAPLAVLSRRMIREAPDIEPVKAAIVLLGMSGDARDASLISHVGRYEELTLYSVAALGDLLKPFGHAAIWALAPMVYGWGRVNAVRGLDRTADPAIKAWMLREGFRNNVGYEYLAHLCATVGGLRDALISESDRDLLVGAAELLTALIHSGQEPGIADYSDGAEACIAFLEQFDCLEPLDLRFLIAALDIRDIVSTPAESHGRDPGWAPETRMELRIKAAAVVTDPRWLEEIGRALTNGDDFTFYLAHMTASRIGIDPWESIFARVGAYFGGWYHLMGTNDPTRVDRVLEKARSLIDLRLVVEGPPSQLGGGLDYEADTSLDFILQDLRRFPGKGLDLVEVGLRGRVPRTRNMALSVLEAWPRDYWLSELGFGLRAALTRETNESIRSRIESLLKTAR